MAASDAWGQVLVGPADRSGPALYDDRAAGPRAARSSYDCGGGPVAWSASGRSLAVGLADGSVSVWRFTDDRASASIRDYVDASSDEAPALRVAFDGEDAVVVVAGGVAEAVRRPQSRNKGAPPVYSPLTVRRVDLCGGTWTPVWRDETNAVRYWDLSPDGGRLFIARSWHGSEQVPFGEALRLDMASRRGQKPPPTSRPKETNHAQRWEVALIDLRGEGGWSAEVPRVDLPAPAFTADGRRLSYMAAGVVGPEHKLLTRRTLFVLDAAADAGAAGRPPPASLTLESGSGFSGPWYFDARGERVLRITPDVRDRLRWRRSGPIQMSGLIGESRPVGPARMVVDAVRIADGATGQGELTLAGTDLSSQPSSPKDIGEGMFVDSAYRVWPLPAVPLATAAPATRPVVTMPDTPRGRLLLPSR